MFREAKNMLAYQAVVDRMLVAVNKGYWKADPEVKAHLERVNREVIAEAGVVCDETSCSSKEVTEFARAEDRKAMAEALAMPAPNIGRQSALSPANAAHQRPATGTVASTATPPASPPMTQSPAESAAKPVSKAKSNSQIEGC